MKNSPLALSYEHFRLKARHKAKREINLALDKRIDEARRAAAEEAKKQLDATRH